MLLMVIFISIYHVYIFIIEQINLILINIIITVVYFINQLCFQLVKVIHLIIISFMKLIIFK